MPAVAIVLPRRSADALDPRLLQPDHRGQRPVDERRRRRPRRGPVRGRAAPRARRRSPGRCCPAATSLIGAAGSDGRLDRDVEAGFVEVAELLRHVDPGVVGVGVEVERQAERLALRRRHVLATSRRRRRGRGRGRAGRRRARSPGCGGASSPAFYRQVTMRRSARASRPKSASAIAERTTTAANSRAVSSWALSCRIRWPRPGVGADPLAEDGADRRRPRRRSWRR